MEMNDIRGPLDLRECQIFQTIGPDGRMVECFFDIEKYKYGMLYRRKCIEDWENGIMGYNDGYISPYIVYNVGKITQVDVPETELRDIFTGAKCATTLSDTVIVYDSYCASGNRCYVEGIAEYIHPASIFEKYKFNVEPSESGCELQNYIETYLNYVENCSGKMTEGNKNLWKQELIKRALLGLMMGMHGDFGIIKRSSGDLELGTYFLGSATILGFDTKENDAKDYIQMDDEQFAKMVEESYTPQFLLPKTNNQISESISYKDVIEYIYKQYPQEAISAYVQLNKCSCQELKRILDKCSDRISPAHIELALRMFETRKLAYDQIHQIYVKAQGNNNPTVDDAR